MYRKQPNTIYSPVAVASLGIIPKRSKSIYALVVSSRVQVRAFLCLVATSVRRVALLVFLSASSILNYSAGPVGRQSAATLLRLYTTFSRDPGVLARLAGLAAPLFEGAVIVRLHAVSILHDDGGLLGCVRCDRVAAIGRTVGAPARGLRTAVTATAAFVIIHNGNIGAVQELFKYVANQQSNTKSKLDMSCCEETAGPVQMQVHTKKLHVPSGQFPFSVQ
jgi:hypothetical protein